MWPAFGRWQLVAAAAKVACAPAREILEIPFSSCSNRLCMLGSVRIVQPQAGMSLPRSASRT
jgi:hypothetical protein